MTTLDSALQVWDGIAIKPEGTNMHYDMSLSVTRTREILHELPKTEEALSCANKLRSLPLAV